jgi:hypothetical protein
METLMLQLALVFGSPCIDVPVDDPNAYAPIECVMTWEIEAKVEEECASLPLMDSEHWARPEFCDAWDRNFVVK